MDEEGGVTDMRAWADYYTVIPMIQSNYYDMLNLYEKYYFMLLNQISNSTTFKLKNAIQAKLAKLRSMLENYNSVKNTGESLRYGKIQYELDKIFMLISESEETGKRLNWKGIMLCKDGIVKAHFLLGLSNIEKEVIDQGQAFSRGRGLG